MSLCGRRKPRRSVVQVSDDAVLDATVAVLSRRPAATFADVGRRARVSEREVRERFGSLDHLIDLALMRGARRIARGVFLEDGTPAEQIALLIARLWDDQQPVAAFALRGPRGHLRIEVEETLEPVRVLVADAVARGAADGEFRSDIPASTVAWLLQHSIVSCLDALARRMVTPAEGRDMAIGQALSIAGLSWTEAASVAATVTKRLR